MSKHITGEQIFDGVFSLAKDCIKNKLGFRDQLQYSNGQSAATFNTIIFKNPEFDFGCSVQMMNYEDINPASRYYIIGYNEKAIELGIPLYNSFGILVKLITLHLLCYSPTSRYRDTSKY